MVGEDWVLAFAALGDSTTVAPSSAELFSDGATAESEATSVIDLNNVSGYGGQRWDNGFHTWLGEGLSRRTPPSTCEFRRSVFHKRGVQRSCTCQLSRSLRHEMRAALHIST